MEAIMLIWERIWPVLSLAFLGSAIWLMRQLFIATLQIKSLVDGRFTSMNNRIEQLIAQLQEIGVKPDAPPVQVMPPEAFMDPKLPEDKLEK